MINMLDIMNILSLRTKQDEGIARNDGMRTRQ